MQGKAIEYVVRLPDETYSEQMELEAARKHAEETGGQLRARLKKVP